MCQRSRIDDLVLARGAEPELGMNVFRRYDLALKDVAEQEVVVHRLGGDLRDRCALKLDERIVLRRTSLSTSIDP